MKCPLVFSSNLTGMGEQRFVFAECLKTECAWYDEYFGKCCIWSLKQVTIDAYLKEEAYHLAEKVKHTMRDRFGVIRNLPSMEER